MDGRLVTALHGSRTALLTTFRRDGRPVATPVSIAVDNGRGYFVTALDSGKARRLSRCDRVAVAPCTVGGDPVGSAVAGRAQLLRSTRVWRARVLRPTGSLFWSWLLYRLRGRSMALYEITLDPVPDGLPDEAPEGRDRPPTVGAASAKIDCDTAHDTNVRLPERLQRPLRLAATTTDTGENRCRRRRTAL